MSGIKNQLKKKYMKNVEDVNKNFNNDSIMSDRGKNIDMLLQKVSLFFVMIGRRTKGVHFSMEEAKKHSKYLIKLGKSPNIQVASLAQERMYQI